jgi:hypothetical protein
MHRFCEDDETLLLIDEERNKEPPLPKFSQLTDGPKVELTANSAPLIGRIMGILLFLTFSKAEAAFMVDRYLSQTSRDVSRAVKHPMLSCAYRSISAIATVMPPKVIGRIFAL